MAQAQDKTQDVEDVPPVPGFDLEHPDGTGMLIAVTLDFSSQNSFLQLALIVIKWSLLFLSTCSSYVLNIPVQPSQLRWQGVGLVIVRSWVLTQAKINWTWFTQPAKIAIVRTGHSCGTQADVLVIAALLYVPQGTEMVQE